MKSITESSSDNGFFGSISASSLRHLLPRSISSSKHKSPAVSKTPRSFDAENTPPLHHPNIKIIDPPLSPSISKPLPPPKITTFTGQTAGSDFQSQAAALPAPPVKGEINGSDGQSEALQVSDPPVKVVVRIRPESDREMGGDVSVRKLGVDTVCISDRKFTFDSVLDSRASQENVFQLVGISLVKSALAGYNASIMSYGQTGSGKTYTMWGPPSAMFEDPSPTSHQGIVPRTFQMLFAEIQKEQENSKEKQINYQCRCSFLEIYKEKIGDLLDPGQRNLEIRDDPKNGLYVENLTEEYVTSYEDVMQILIKGLSTRKVGATSINSKSSRSHVVFTLIMESWCKGTSSKCFSSSKISRISFIDLAGLDRNAPDDAGKQFIKEGAGIKKSLSRLGKLVHTLAKGTRQLKIEDVPYKGSCLTHLLQESLGGNAKLTVICNISSDGRNNGETLRTLRFGKQIKSIRNEPVINEISEDDVNDLSDQIRQLKEELVRTKSDACYVVGSKNQYCNQKNVRESLNHLRLSLNRSLMLPQIDNDSNSEVDVDENDIRQLHQHLDSLHSSSENSRALSNSRDSANFASVEESFETDLMSEDEMNGPDDIANEETNLGRHKDNVACKDDLLSSNCNALSVADPALRSSISISLCHQSSVLQEPTLSESPKIANTRKSLGISSTLSVSRNNASKSSNFKSDAAPHLLRQSEHIRSSLRSSNNIKSPTDSLAASLQRGLQIIDNHQRNSASNRSSVSFSFEHLTLKPSPEVDGAHASALKLLEEKPSSEGPSALLLCASCQKKVSENSFEVQDCLKRWIVVGNSGLMTQATKGEDNLAEAHKREKELKNVCLEQAAKIEQLNQMVEQYKHVGEDSVTKHDQKSDSLCVEGSMNQTVLVEGCHSLEDQNKFLRSNIQEDRQTELVKEISERKEVWEVMDHGNSYSDTKEKEALLKEIQNLRTQLQSYADGSRNQSTEKLRSSLLARSIQLRKSVDVTHVNEEEFEQERQRWTEMESEWISLTDDLRIDLESSRRHAEKVEMELNLEKRCTEELDDALHRAVLGHARMIEHYAELQEKYNDLVGKHRAIMEGIAEVKRAAEKAGKKGRSRFAKSLAAELSSLRVEREKERELLKKENKGLRIQLRDTAEAVHAAGELLVRLREAEQTASVAEENFTNVQQENEKLKKQIEKLKRKHKMEMITMKQYMAESKLPESALQPLYREESDVAHSTIADDDQAWRAEFGAIYQEHY